MGPGGVDPAWRSLVERVAWRYRRGHLTQAGAPDAPQRRGEAGDALLAGGAMAFAAYCVRASGGATEGGHGGGGGGANVDATERRTGGA